MWVPVAGTCHRIAFARYADDVLDGVIHPDGRFHRHGQPALFASPSPEALAVAIDNYLNGSDAPCVMISLDVTCSGIVDLGDPASSAELGIDPSWPSVPWAEEPRGGLSCIKSASV